MARLERSFYALPTGDVARDLLGCVLWTRSPEGLTGGRIVEVEAYLDESDPASHAAWLRRGQSIMSGPPGTVYMYRSYGVHAMFNVVAEPEGTLGAVLVRALEPVAGLDLMKERRGVERERLLCAGPGRLCQALGLTLADNGEDLPVSERVWIDRGTPPKKILTTERIGITKGVDALLRFVVPGNPYLSRPAPL